MTYQIPEPPFAVTDFKGMPKSQLKIYYHWFMNQIQTRVGLLLELVHDTDEYKDWVADYSMDSFSRLNDWFALQVETYPRSAEQTAEMEKKLPFGFEVDDFDLTTQTLAIAFDIGIYLGQVMLRQHPSLKWEQSLKNKRFIEYGKPVLVGFKVDVPMDPIHLMIVQAYGLAKGNRTPQRFLAGLSIWSDRVILP